MIDLDNKSKEEMLREKAEADLRYAKRQEAEWRRRMDKERKCMIGGTFHKYVEDALLFEPDEWDQIVKAVIRTDAFRRLTDEFRRIADERDKAKEVARRKTEEEEKRRRDEEKEKAKKKTKSKPEKESMEEDQEAERAEQEESQTQGMILEQNNGIFNSGQ